MPYYKKGKKGKKSKFGSTVSTLNQPGSSPFPVSYLTRHRYVETIKLTPTIGTPDYALYAANGMYDPTVAVGGHQPLGFDQLVELYDHYAVLGSKVTVQAFSTNPAGDQGSAMMFIYTNDDVVPVSTFDTVMEQRNGVVAPVSSSDAGQTCKLSQKFSAKSFFGVSDVNDNAQLKGTAAANPSDGAYFVIGAQCIDSAINGFAIDCVVTIDYTALWTEPVALLQS